jgi:hypothetical protein
MRYHHGMTIQDAARTYFGLMQDLRAGKITPDQMREAVKPVRDSLSPADWDLAKVMVIRNDQRTLGV